MIDKPKPANIGRQTKIVAAGQQLFLRHGLRGATMEAIAREAGVAKPTLYSYFPDKEAVFDAVMAELVTQMKIQVRKRLERDGSVAAQIAGALAAKHKMVFRLLEGSPHAAELYGEGARAAAPQMERFERWLQGELSKVLSAGGYQDGVKYVPLLMACAAGIAGKARHAEQIGPAVRLVTEKLLA